MKWKGWFSTGLGITLGLAAICTAGTAALAQDVLSADQAKQAVTVREVSADGDFVTGVVDNHTSRALRDVRLEIEHSWLWKNERKPGNDNPGRVDYYTVTGEIAPGGSERFTYKISPPLPVHADGSFVTSASVVGFSEVGQ